MLTCITRLYVKHFLYPSFYPWYYLLVYFECCCKFCSNMYIVLENDTDAYILRVIGYFLPVALQSRVVRKCVGIVTPPSPRQSDEHTHTRWLDDTRVGKYADRQTHWQVYGSQADVLTQELVEWVKCTDRHRWRHSTCSMVHRYVDR